MTKRKCKSAIAAVSAAALLLASGASASGLHGAGNEVVVASVRISSKQGLNDDPPPNNLDVTEKVITETAPFQKRSLEDEKDRDVVDETAGGLVSDAEKDKKAKKDKKKDPNKPKRNSSS